MAGSIALCAYPALGNSSSDSIAYKGPGGWVVDTPPVNTAETIADTPFHFVYVDNQVHEAADGTEDAYTAYRVKILKSEGLPAGNITVTWQPDQGPATVHYVRLIRAGQVTDVLATTKFTVVQREEQLEQSTLTGQRTAVLQVPGVQLGDELAVALTIQRREKAFGGHVANVMQLPILGSKGIYRFRLLWPNNRKISLRSTNDLIVPATSSASGEHVVEVTLRDPTGAVPTDHAPARYNLRRMVEFSDYDGWADLSHQLAPLFEHAATIAAGSPLQAEISAIASRTQDPVERAQAALQLVEERVRYVYVGLNGGNYLPASADETWQRRFGDCKGKAALLVALLRKLGIGAQVALVNSKGGDGIDQLLPGQQWFDHVVVRAVIANKVVWLDSTRQGDRYLDNLTTPFRWALPLSSQGSDLEKIEPHDLKFPTLVTVLDIDAAAGTDQDAHVAVQNVFHGDEAFLIRTQLASLSTEDADRALKNYWHQQLDWATPDKVNWNYDERRMAITLRLVGRGNPGWTGDVSKGHSLILPGAGFYKPEPMRRPADQDQSATWVVEFPHFSCWATTVRLPKAASKLAWSLDADSMNQRLAGKIYWRASGLSGNVARTIMSVHSYEPEASSQEALALNKTIPNFNNSMSTIAEELPADVVKSIANLPFSDDVDWVNAPAPCSPK